MKTMEELELKSPNFILEQNICKNYYDNLTIECKPDNLLKAMEEYGKQCFEAGRQRNIQICDNKIFGSLTFENYKDYKLNLK